jgi:hypothetical protein
MWNILCEQAVHGMVQNDMYDLSFKELEYFENKILVRPE